MANTKISALPAGTALDGTEVAPFVQGGATVKITGAQIKTYALNTPVIAGQTTINLNTVAAPGAPHPGVQLQGADAAATGYVAMSYGSASTVDLGRSAGTAASPTTVLSGGPLGFVRGYGYDGSSWASGGALRFVTTQDWTTSAHGTQAAIQATANGSITPADILIVTTAAVAPATDNAVTCGASGTRWSTVYAATGAINTSDAREKTWRGAATAAEVRAAKRIVAELGFYQWNDAIAEKGPDGARYHFGVRAQAVRDILTSEGLEAASYGFLCYDEWAAIEQRGEPVDEDYVAPREAGDRWGIRPDELTMFLIGSLLA